MFKKKMMIALFVLSFKKQIQSRPDEYVKIAGISEDYISLPKNQGSEGLCYVFATLSYLEMEYAIFSDNRIRTSPEQVSNNIVSFFNTESYTDDLIFNRCKQMNPPNKDARYGGEQYCVLDYVEYRGLMFEHDYPYNNGNSADKYSNSKISPLKIDNIDYMRFTEDNITIFMNETHEEIAELPITIEQLFDYAIFPRLESGHPLLISINAEHLFGQVIEEINETRIVNHAVVLTSIGKLPGNNPDHVYAEILNSWGDNAYEGGFQYIHIGDISTGKFYNNMNMFSELYYADIFHSVMPIPQMSTSGIKSLMDLTVASIVASVGSMTTMLVLTIIILVFTTISCCCGCFLGCRIGGIKESISEIGSPINV